MTPAAAAALTRPRPEAHPRPAPAAARLAAAAALCACALATACTLPRKPQTYPFPKAWQGTWAGTLHIYPPAGPPQAVPMTLRIGPLQDPAAPPAAQAFHITYGPQGHDSRPYSLLPHDTARGHYRLDEHNGILLDQYLRGNTLASRFEVAGTLLEALYTRGHRHIQFQIIAGPTAQALARPSGDTIIGTDTIPPVIARPIQVYQQATLRRR